MITAEKAKTYSRIIAVLTTWGAIILVGIGGIELYARHAQGYLMWSFPLRRSHFFELDRLKIWNRRFYEEHRADFQGWPIPLEFFDAEKPTPMYLFKPNLRMAVNGNRLVPAARDQVVDWSSNSWGFRGPEFSITKPAGVIRIVCLGASTTEGSQADNETFPYYLQQELNRIPGRKIEVINAGHHAYGMDDLLALLRARVLPLDPDIVLVYEAANDIDFSSFVRNMPCPLGSCWLRSYPRWYRWLSESSAAFVLLSDRLGWTADDRVPPPMPHQFDETSPKPSAAHYRAVLTEIVRETLAHRSAIVLSSFVTVAHAGLTVTYAENHGLFTELFRTRYPLTPEELARIFAYFNRQSRDVAAAFRAPYADVAAKFPREVRYFPFDSIHLSPEGNHLLAREFSTFLAQKVLSGTIGVQEAAPSNAPHTRPQGMW